MTIEDIRGQFPALDQQINGAALTYLDSAATALKPRAVVDAVTAIYTRDTANVHRGAHTLSTRATAAYERARATIAAFVGGRPNEVVMCHGTTEAINLVAWSWAYPRLAPGDEIVVTELEHHSNLVPWQRVAQATGATIVAAKLDATMRLTADAVAEAISDATRIVAVTALSNAIGGATPVAEIAELARRVGAVVVVDGAQLVAHRPVDVGVLGCDFFAFSGHKVYGPDAVGVLWGRADRLAAMEPWQAGGNMIDEVQLATSTYAEPPMRFEAGTPPIAGTVGLAAAITWMSELGWSAIEASDRLLVDAAVQQLAAIDAVTLHGPADRVACVAFSVAGVHPHDLATVADASGVAIRSGHHCAQPLMRRLGVDATARASFGVYNQVDDVAVLAQAIERAVEMFS